MSQNETSGTVAVDNQKIRTKQMVLIALMTAVTCVLGPLSIPLPFSPVPISLTNFAIFLAIFVLGMKNGTISFIIYLLLGAVGVPVFSSFRGGFQVLAGPTGGYLIGFIFLALIMGFALDHFDRKLVPTIIGMIIGMAVCYTFGTVWLAKLLSLSFKEGLMMGVIPYLAGDVAKSSSQQSQVQTLRSNTENQIIELKKRPKQILYCFCSGVFTLSSTSIFP